MHVPRIPWATSLTGAGVSSSRREPGQLAAGQMLTLYPHTALAIAVGLLIGKLLELSGFFEGVTDEANLSADAIDRSRKASQDYQDTISDMGLKKVADELDTEFMAKQTPGFSGADIANVCNEAALIAARLLVQDR